MSSSRLTALSSLCLFLLPTCASDPDGQGRPAPIPAVMDAAVPPSDSVAAPATTITGTWPRYHVQAGVARNDLSGVAHLPGQHLLLGVDDGGDAPQDPLPFPVAALGGDLRFAELRHPLMDAHGDLEGATFDGEWAYVTSSMSGEYKEPRFHALSRFKVREGAISEAVTIAPRAAVMRALETQFGADWYGRIEALEGRKGGLNVEGLTATPTKGKLLLGLRSPHFGATFPADLKSGAAIVVELDATGFGGGPLLAEASTVDLGGAGIRSIEYSPAAGGYFISAGPVEKAADFTLFFWKGPSAPAVPVDVPEYKSLCRPEAVAEMEFDGRKYLFVGSEESDDTCFAQPFNYVLVEMTSTFVGRLR